MFITFICAAVVLSTANSIIGVNVPIASTSGAAGWVVFVTIISMPLEGIILASRFLNFPFASKYGFIVHIVVSRPLV